METAPSLDPQPSPNTFIIRPQATKSHIIFPSMTLATIMVHIIFLPLMYGQALTGMDIQATTIIGRAAINQECQATMNRVKINQVDGLAHSITIRAQTNLDGRVNLINGQVHITNQIGRAHTTTTNHLGQIFLLILVEFLLNIKL
jgi:hypothetical protein